MGARDPMGWMGVAFLWVLEVRMGWVGIGLHLWVPGTHLGWWALGALGCRGPFT